MKRMAVFLVVVCLISGCKNSDGELNQVIGFRQQLLSASLCQFETDVTADYGDKLFTFSAQCQVQGDGQLQFAITAPESIQGITGKISDSGGKLTFDNTALHFPLLAEEELSPVSAPWIFIKTLRSGYLKSVGKEEQNFRVAIDDSYAEDALHLDIWLDETLCPIRADILHEGTRILSLTIKNFQIV